jgi:phage terminase Nu1 subunit (DNA packaging protein)
MRYNYRINDYLNLNDESIFDEIRSSTSEIDQKKTDIAKAPNTVHNLDSDIVS